MFFILSKILSFLSSPLTWVFILMLWSIKTKSKSRKKRLNIISISVLFFFSNSFVVDEIFRLYEQRDDITKQMDSHFDIAIVLGGFMTYDPISNLEGFHESSDRFLHAYRLLKQGKVDKVLLSGGSGSILRAEDKEAELMRLFLLKIGEDREHFIFETESKNTRQNAVNSALAIKKNKPNGKYLLITSGYHMPRALKCFEKVGVPVTPYSVDHYIGERRYEPDYLLMPNTGALERWRILIHEWMGRVTYKLMGYI